MVKLSQHLENYGGFMDFSEVACSLPSFPIRKAVVTLSGLLEACDLPTYVT